MQSTKRTWPALSLFILPILCASSLPAQYQGQYQSQPGQYDQNDPPASIARIGYLRGNVSLQAYGSDQWTQAPPNYPMVGGDRIYTGPRARAVVQLGGAELRLWQATDVSLTNLSDQFQQIGLAAGTLRLRVFEMNSGGQIEVDTPNGAALIESPGDYRFEAFPQTNAQDASSIVTINSGNAQITGPGINQPVSGGYSIGLFGTNPVQLQYLDVPEYDDLDYWSLQLDQRLERSVSARYVSRQMVGYGDLDDYGTWNSNTEYGPGWFPNQVPYGWRPYSTGHWAYIQPWGYTWVDDEPWGFAPFHYGRWSQIDGRWGWFPGPPSVRPVYSPALVAFVGGGPGYDGARGDGYDRRDDGERGGGSGGISFGISFGGGIGISAWFPIGVGEPYVPPYRCSPRYAEQVNATNVNVNVIRNTTIVNNYNTYINKTVINNTVMNHTTVNTFNYANRGQVTAVPASAVASGASVARQAVQLSPQQRQQIAVTPIAYHPSAPAPIAPHPSLVPVSNVARPIARPILMTPTGEARAVPGQVQARPIVIAKLPPPRVVPANAPPPPAAPRPVQINRPGTPVPVAAPVRIPPQPAPPTRPVYQPAPPARPAPEPLSPLRPAPAPIARPTPAPAPIAQPRPMQPAPSPTPTPVNRPLPQPVQQAPAPVNRPAPQPVQQAPAPVNRPSPQPIARPTQPSPEPRPAPAPATRPEQPARPVPPPPASVRPAPAPAIRPTPPAQPTPSSQPRPVPAPVVRQLPQPAPVPQRPSPPAEVKPVPKPLPNEDPAPKDEKKQSR